MKSERRTFKKFFFCFLLLTYVSTIALYAQQDSTSAISQQQYQTADHAPGDKIVPGDLLRRASTSNLWNAIVALEPSLADNSSDLYGDMPYYTPQNNTLARQHGMEPRRPQLVGAFPHRWSAGLGLSVYVPQHKRYRENHHL